MRDSGKVVVGVDVGAEKKGYHAVALFHGAFIQTTKDRDPARVLAFCLEHGAEAVAVDGPSGWSKSGSSRECERMLGRIGMSCFYTPSKAVAENRRFYQWVLNGKRLYDGLAQRYPLYTGHKTGRSICIETFPHAVLCAIIGLAAPKRPKAAIRRLSLQHLGYDCSKLTNIDFLDAGLCAVTADRFLNSECDVLGEPSEGFIIVPRISGRSVIQERPR
jgi:predicted RNase H-like nuclease